MKLADDVYLIGSGSNGMNMTDPYDCHIYLLDGGDEIAVIDIGAGLNLEAIYENIVNNGFSLNDIDYLILTHAHADHSGGAKKFVDKTGAKVIASKKTAEYLQNGDEAAISLQKAKEAGIYPLDYRYESCPVDWTVQEGDVVSVGNYSLKVIETPGHSGDHISFLTESKHKTYLFAGDVIFYGGRIQVQYIYDCNVLDYGDSIYKLENLKIDCLFAGHDTIVLNDGQQHIQMAIETLKTLGMPKSLF